MDVRDLNKACPEDTYPLPQIDQLVIATCGHEMVSFMDASLGYNPTKMNLVDKSQTSFYVDSDILYCKVMPFRLVNACAICHGIVNKIFENMLGQNMEVYLDDMLINKKS